MLLTIAFVLILYLLWRASTLASQLATVEHNLRALERRKQEDEVPIFVPTVQPQAPPPLPQKEEPVQPVAIEPPPLPTPVVEIEQPQIPEKPNVSWEERIGGNLLNKIGAVILVIGIALFLGYSFASMGPLGRVCTGFAVSLSILAGGLYLERKEDLRAFARGLIATGWAATYFTSYSMSAIDAAKVIDSPVIGLAAMAAVATAMVVHSLRYRVQSLTALAYGCVYAALALSELNAAVVLALFPLAGSMLWLARRFAWNQLTPFAAAATYAVFLSRGDSGSPLWTVQVLLLAFWILFEAADLLAPSRLAFAINSLAGLGASAYAWQHKDPESMWLFCCGASALYLATTLVRAASKQDARASLSISAVLAALGIFAHTHGLWTAIFLAAEAELLFLAGHHLEIPAIRVLSYFAFFASLSSSALATGQWTPALLVHAALFYVNRALRSTAPLFGYAASVLAATAIGIECPWRWTAAAWIGFAIVLFETGVWRKLAEFRYQGYGVAALGLISSAAMRLDPQFVANRHSAFFTAAATLFYALRATRGLQVLAETERAAIRTACSIFVPLLVATALTSVTPELWWGVAWLAAAMILLELALHSLPAVLLLPALVLATAGAGHTVLQLRWETFAASGAIALIAALRLLWIRQPWITLLRGSMLAVACVFGWAAMWLGGTPHAWIPAIIAACAYLFAELGRALKAIDFEFAGHGLSACAAMLVIFMPPVQWPALFVIATHAAFAVRFRMIEWHGWPALTIFALWLHQAAGDNASAPLAVAALALLAIAEHFEITAMRWQAYIAFALAAAGYVWAGPDAAIWARSVMAATLLPATLLSSRERQSIRAVFAAGLAACTAILLFEEASGGMLSIALGLEGIALLGTGFAAKERSLRLSGLALLLLCAGKLFAYDLSGLEKVYRIASFLCLGVILMAASWAYTRFKSLF